MKGLLHGNLETCIIAADQFFNIANALVDDTYCAIPDAIRPFFVNAAFACELYLKAIMIFESENDEFSKGHDLKDLFERISDDAKLRIRTNYDGLYMKTHKVAFDKLLGDTYSPFVTWRYTFESPAEGNSHELWILMKSLREYVSMFR